LRSSTLSKLAQPSSGSSNSLTRSTTSQVQERGETAGKARNALLAAHGKRRGDPMHAAKAFISALEAFSLRYTA
jgi:hypothetical protein